MARWPRFNPQKTAEVRSEFEDRRYCYAMVLVARDDITPLMVYKGLGAPKSGYGGKVMGENKSRIPPLALPRSGYSVGN